ncbi:hypothetical protein OIV83_006303 [Microbotryomycetes sp. JL201]|nr:hypothetical protein OIV83_006303 [Microbotryomycetes sp. JL201]
MQGFRKFNLSSDRGQSASSTSWDGVFHRAHAHAHGPLRRRQAATACQLYTFPKSRSLVPVLAPVDITWDAQCAADQEQQFGASVDVLLSVQTDKDGMLPVHLWQSVDFQSNKLSTQLNPTWWNASTGAGRITAQFSLVPSGNPIWDTPVAAGPSFVVFYNGSYPSLTNTGPLPAYTGPSVESAGGQRESHAGGLTGGKLGAAVAIPLLAVAVAVAVFLLWSRWRKKPEQKRWSAVVDERMSMVSHGTWQPRVSMASRPGSFHPGASAASIRSGMSGHARPPYATGSDGRPGSTYSANVPSPLGGNSTVRAPPAAEMRQIGSGERISRISFAGLDHHQRPSFSSSRTGPPVPRPHSMHNNLSSMSNHRSAKSSSSLGVPVSKPKLHRAESDQTVYHSARSASGSSNGSAQSKSSLADDVEGELAHAPLVSRSGTMEELSAPMSPGARARQPGGNAYKASIASSLRNDIAGLPAVAMMRQDGASTPDSGDGVGGLSATKRLSLASARDVPRVPKPALHVDTSRRSVRLPMIGDEAIRSPDEALASYATQAILAGGATSRPVTRANKSPMHADSAVGGGGNRLTKSASQFISQPAKKWLKSLSRPFIGGARKPPTNELERSPNAVVDYSGWNAQFGEKVVDQDEYDEKAFHRGSAIQDEVPLSATMMATVDNVHERARSPFDGPVEERPVHGLNDVELGRASFDRGQMAQSRASKRSMSVKRQQRQVEQAAKDAQVRDPYAEFDESDSDDDDGQEGPAQVGMAL